MKERSLTRGKISRDQLPVRALAISAFVFQLDLIINGKKSREYLPATCIPVECATNALESVVRFSQSQLKFPSFARRADYQLSELPLSGMLGISTSVKYSRQNSELGVEEAKWLQCCLQTDLILSLPRATKRREKRSKRSDHSKVTDK